MGLKDRLAADDGGSLRKGLAETKMGALLSGHARPSPGDLTADSGTPYMLDGLRPQGPSGVTPPITPRHGTDYLFHLNG